MKNYTIQDARNAYTKADFAFAYQPKTTPEMLIAFYSCGLIWKVYQNQVVAIKATRDDFALYSQSEMNRVAFKWLKFKR